VWRKKSGCCGGTEVQAAGQKRRRELRTERGFYGLLEEKGLHGVKDRTVGDQGWWGHVADVYSPVGGGRGHVRALEKTG
jgi:hypothetical protein